MATSKRIPKQNITHPSPAIFAAGSIDETFLINSPDAISSNVDLSSYGIAGSFLTSASLMGLPTVPISSVVEEEKKILPEIIGDVPNLVDIESVTFEEYPDPLTGVSKYNAIIKIRNSSKNKASISGVDARIYNPNSVKTYSFTPTVVASGSVQSPIITTTTWYNAQSKCNPFSGVYGSVPAIVGTAQYQADGSDVPADSTSGPYSARIKSVWRKTSAEALEAAKNSSCEIAV